MRLSGWQRLGIVASVLWIIAGGLIGNDIGLSEGEHVGQAYARCLAQRSVQEDGSVPRDTDWEPCKAKFENDWPEAIKYHWHYAAAFAFLPLPFAWLVGWGLLNVVRWIRAGFRRQISE